MALAPIAERTPTDLDRHWAGVWRQALRTMKAQGTWAWELRPLLDEYVYALRGAESCRLESQIDWDRHTKRASALADQLVLTPRGRKVVGCGVTEEAKSADPLEEFDELAQKRAGRTG